MRVCFVVGTLGQGGAERQLVFMLRALISCGISSTVLCPRKGEYFEGVISELGIPVKFIDRARSRPAQLLKLIRLVRSEKADVVQSSHFFINMYVGLVGRTLGIPSIGAIRSDFDHEMRVHGVWGNWQIRLPRYLITNSLQAYKRALQCGVSPDRIGFVRNVTEPPRDNFRKSTSSVKRIIFVGRLDSDKCPEQFIRLAGSLLKRLPNESLQFMVIGDGPLRPHLEALALSLNLPSNVLKFCGSLSDLHSIYSEADILVSTSRREGTSNVILEAMAYGLPIVATRVGGTPEIVNGDRGILVFPGDEKGLEDAVLRLILDRNLCERLGHTGKVYAKSNHSIEYLQERLPDIYDRLIRNG